MKGTAWADIVDAAEVDDFELFVALAVPALVKETVNSCRDRELPSNIEEKNAW